MLLTFIINFFYLCTTEQVGYGHTFLAGKLYFVKGKVAAWQRDVQTL